MAGEVAFRSHHNAYLAVKEGHLASDHKVEAHSKFILGHHHHHATLQNHFGKFLGVDGSGTLVIHEDSHHESTHFTLEHHHGKVAIKTHHGAYISLDHEHKVHLTHERGHDELFDEVHA